MNMSPQARIAIGAAIGWALFTLGVLLCSGQARADVPPNCQTDLWGFLGSQVRAICDGPIRPDGSWMRERAFIIPAHDVPFTCHTYGGTYSSSTSCSGGYFQDTKILGDETYPVTPETVLADEPGHLS